MEGVYREIGLERGPSTLSPNCKITVVGAGAVGLAAAYAILIKGYAKPLVLIDIFENKVKGEVKDLQHAVPFSDSDQVIGGTDYSLTEGSKVCVITAGARQAPGQSRLDLLEQNITVIKNIIHELIKYSPDAFYIIATNPVDILTYAAWKMTDLPLNKIIGTGTNLDSARFRSCISQFYGVPVHTIEGYIIGEHGETSVPVWSQVRIAGHNVHCFGETFTEENKESIHTNVVNSAAELIELKGYTSSGIGLAIQDIVECILQDKKVIRCVSTLVKGLLDVEEEVFTSLPCMIGNTGICLVTSPDLSDEECSKFKNSTMALLSAQNEINHLLST